MSWIVVQYWVYPKSMFNIDWECQITGHHYGESMFITSLSSWTLITSSESSPNSPWTWQLFKTNFRPCFNRSLISWLVGCKRAGRPRLPVYSLWRNISNYWYNREISLLFLDGLWLGSLSVPGWSNAHGTELVQLLTYNLLQKYLCPLVPEQWCQYLISNDRLDLTLSSSRT